MVCTNSWKICCINKDSSSVENIRALDATFIYLWVPGQAMVWNSLMYAMVLFRVSFQVFTQSTWVWSLKMTRKEIIFWGVSFCSIKFVLELYKPGSYIIMSPSPSLSKQDSVKQPSPNLLVIISFLIHVLIINGLHDII